MLTEFPCKMHSYCELRQKNLEKIFLGPGFLHNAIKSPFLQYVHTLSFLLICRNVTCLLMGNNKTHVVSYMIYVLSNQKGH